MKNFYRNNLEYNKTCIFLNIKIDNYILKKEKL